LKFHNICIEVTFINTNTDTVEAKKEAAKKKRREREKRKRDEKKATAFAKRVLSRSKARSKSAQDNGDDSDNSISGNAAKRQKQETVEQKVTVYIHVQFIAPQPSRHALTARSKGKIEAAAVAIRGPCFFQLDQTYDDFKRIIAKELPCKLRLLPTAQVTWKYEKPANDPKKPLSSNAGYEAMVISLTERKANHVIVVSMPPPKADDMVSQS
jgi:hypothetical protein